MRHYSVCGCLFSFLLGSVLSAAEPVRVLVWDEQQPEQKKAYGDQFLGETIAAYLSKQPGLSVTSTSLSAPQQGLDPATLDAADVLVFWSHVRQKEQDDARVEDVVRRVMSGQLGFVALHSAHWSKPFVRLMQERAKVDAIQQVPEADRATAKWEYTNESPYGKVLPRSSRVTPFVEKVADNTWKLTLPQCVFPAYRGDGAPSHLTTLLPNHPIAQGLPVKWELPQTEMYDEPFHVPAPDEVVFMELWDKGERFRSGCVWQIGKGRVFYFRPGHETFPVFRQPEALRVIRNAVKWAKP